MKKTLAILMALLLMIPMALAEDMDLSEFTDAELDGLEQAIEAEREARAKAAGEAKAGENAAEESEKAAEESDFKALRAGREDKNNTVLQQKLKDLGYLTGQVDGIFGPQTEKALKVRQKELGMEETGVVNSQEELDKILGVTVGDGENLALGTEEAISFVPSGDKSWCKPVGFYPTSENGFAKLANIENKVFTLSFDWQASGADQETEVAVSLRHMAEKKRYKSVGSFVISKGESSGHCEITFEPTDEMRQFGTDWLIGNIGDETVNRGLQIDVSNFKFETGERATAWTPAP